MVDHDACWGMFDLTAHLVVFMETSYYDGAEHRYVDYPITDMIEMMGKGCSKKVQYLAAGGRKLTHCCFRSI